MAEGAPTRVDDASIANDEILWRRICPGWLKREADGSYRPQSLSFTDRRSGELSVHRACMTTWQKVLQNYPDHSIAAFQADIPRSDGLIVVSDPTPDDPSHTLICPAPSQKQAKKIALNCKWERLYVAEV